MPTRHQLVAGLGIAAIGLAVAWTSSSQATAGSSRVGPTHRSDASSLISSHIAAASACARQDDNDNGVGVISQNFEEDFDSFDSRGADDFTIKRTCTVSEVRVNGAYFTGVGPAVSLHVTFYHDDNGTPGRRVDNQNDLAYRDPSGLGNFKIPLESGVPFRPGTYWVAVKANIEFRVGGEWGWNTNNTARGHNAQWKNGGDGFGTGCRQYAEILTCLGDEGQGPDFSFALLK